MVNSLCYEGGNGRTGRDWQKLLPLLHSRLGKSWNVCFFLQSMLSDLNSPLLLLLDYFSILVRLTWQRFSILMSSLFLYLSVHDCAS